MLKQTLFISVLLVAIAMGGSSRAGAEPSWEGRALEWRLAMTGPHYAPDDYGTLPGEEERVLLERYRPRVYVAPGGLLPVDFYGWYLPRTVVRSIRDGTVVEENPTRGYLKRIERDPRFCLDFTGPMMPCEDCAGYVATAYGRAYRETARLRTPGGGVREVPVIILKYSFAFPYSGLPAELGAMKELLAGVVTDPVRLHELDIHGSVQVVLDDSGRPMVLLLAQHNSFRSYLIGRDVTLAEDGRARVCFAGRSNEPYPCPEGPDNPGPVLHRAVGNPEYTAFVVDGRNKPLLSGHDRVFGPASGAAEVSYRLEYLPTHDPLYMSWMPLGDVQGILSFATFYRKGPPGIELNTHPELKRYGDLMQFWYFRDDSAEDAEVMERAFDSFTEVDVETVLVHNGTRLYLDMVETGNIEKTGGVRGEGGEVSGPMN